MVGFCRFPGSSIASIQTVVHRRRYLIATCAPKKETRKKESVAPSRTLTPSEDLVDRSVPSAALLSTLHIAVQPAGGAPAMYQPPLRIQNDCYSFRRITQYSLFARSRIVCKMVHEFVSLSSLTPIVANLADCCSL